MLMGGVLYSIPHPSSSLWSTLDPNTAIHPLCAINAKHGDNTMTHKPYVNTIFGWERILFYKGQELKYVSLIVILMLYVQFCKVYLFLFLYCFEHMKNMIFFL
jgi:hypothetical protein